MANGGGPRRGLGIAFQGKIDQPEYLLQQARRRKAAEAAAEKQKQEAKKQAMEDLGDINKDIHPVYNPAIQKIKNSFYKGAKQLRKQDPDNFTNTTEYSKLKDKTRMALKKLKESSDNIRSYRDTINNNPNMIGHPEIMEAVSKQNHEKLKKLTGSELGLFGKVPMKQYDPAELNKEIADDIGWSEELQDLKGAGGFRQFKKKIQKMPGKKDFEQALRAKYQSNRSLQEFASEYYDAPNEDAFVESQLEFIPKETEVSTKNIPDRDDDGGGGDGRSDEGQTLFGGLPEIIDQNRQEIVDRLSKGKMSGKDFVDWYANTSKMRKKPTDVSDVSYDWSGPGEGKIKLGNLQEIYTNKEAKEGSGIDGDKEAKESSGIDGDSVVKGKKFQPRVTSDDQQVPLRVKDIKTTFGYYDDDGNLKIITDESELNDPDIASKVKPVLRKQVEPVQADGDIAGAEAMNTAATNLEKKVDDGSLYEYTVLGYRGAADKEDADYYRANEYFSEDNTIPNPPEGERGDTKYNIGAFNDENNKEKYELPAFK